MNLQSVNLRDKLTKFSDHWSPKIIADMNDHQFKLVKFQGEFVWHKHADTDEVFIVLDGEMTIHLHGSDVKVKAGELVVVPRGVEHKTGAQHECSALIVEKLGTVNTGDALSDLISPAGVWI
jgi:mannose-6-phosphate isomerase-like protein (cupin superfamily)